ncbi:MAG: inorganic phosphate transporter [Thermoplasmata archaeon]|nr:MAG: inorganic phosphate transporter [Thermoplasmata archaeon]
MVAFSIAILIIALAAGFYMAWSIGANDVANSMASAVGAKAITMKQAVFIAGILTICGAVFLGAHVTGTISKGIVDPNDIGDPTKVMFGALAAILAAAIWVTLATWKSMPISTTHSIVGAVIGFGLVAGGAGVVSWAKVGQVAVSWILSPLFGCILAFIVFKLITRLILGREEPLVSAKKTGPFFIAATFFIIFMSLLLKTRLGEMIIHDNELLWAFVISTIMAAISGLIGYLIIRNVERKSEEGYEEVEEVFRKLQIMTSCYVALAHGANDVANAIGPVATVFAINEEGAIPPEVSIPVYLLAIGGIGIAIGIMTWGYRVIRTLGSKITKLTNTRGFSVDFGAATTVLVASKFGMPISTTHTVVGAIIGVGLARGLEAVDLRIIKKIVLSWLITLPIAAITAALIYLGLISLI